MAKRARKSGTRAVHARTADGSNHAVGIGNLRVVLLQDGDKWFAQAYEIDYAAEGTTLANAQKNFERGLELTIHAHLEAYGSIDRLLVPVSPTTFQKLAVSAAVHPYRYSHVSFHSLSKLTRALRKLAPAGQLSFPYDQIVYLKQAA